MNWKLFAISLMVGTALLTSCNKPSTDAAGHEHHEGHDHDGHDHHGHNHENCTHGSLLDLDKPAGAPAPADAAEFEVGCGKCNMGLEGDSCEIAIKVDGKAYYTTSAPVDAHAIGLCKATAKAKVAGKVEGDKFAITGFTLVDAAPKE